MVLSIVLTNSGDNAFDEDSETSISSIDLQRHETIRSILAPVSGDTVFDLDSPEFSPNRIASLDWLVEQDQAYQLPIDDPSLERQIHQLYVIALLYLSTNGEEWDRQYRFFSGPNEYDWTSIASQFIIEDTDIFDYVDNGSLMRGAFFAMKKAK